MLKLAISTIHTGPEHQRIVDFVKQTWDVLSEEWCFVKCPFTSYSGETLTTSPLLVFCNLQEQSRQISGVATTSCVALIG